MKSSRNFKKETNYSGKSTFPSRNFERLDPFWGSFEISFLKSSTTASSRKDGGV